MDPILLKTPLTAVDINTLIEGGANDMDINQNKRDEIQEEAEKNSLSYIDHKVDTNWVAVRFVKK